MQYEELSKEELFNLLQQSEKKVNRLKNQNAKLKKNKRV